jgi:hypothetical protein
MKQASLFLLVSTGLFSLAACSDTTGPGDSPLRVVSASVLVNGNAVSDAVRPDHGDSLRFEAQVAPAGSPLVRRIRVEHWMVVAPRSRGGGDRGSFRLRGVIELYDDGTHGDRVSGDGLYGHEGELFDMMQFMGQPMDRMSGEHIFQVFAEDIDGNHSNHVSLGMRVR